MKNFSELLATELHLDVVINNTELSVGLNDHLVFKAADVVIIDGIEILPKYRYLVLGNRLTIDEPFYCWYHRISGQGWLLTPQ